MRCLRRSLFFPVAKQPRAGSCVSVCGNQGLKISHWMVNFTPRSIARSPARKLRFGRHAQDRTPACPLPHGDNFNSGDCSRLNRRISTGVGVRCILKKLFVSQRFDGIQIACLLRRIKPKKTPTAPEYPEELTTDKQKKGVKEKKGPSRKPRSFLNFLLVAARGSGKRKIEVSDPCD